VPGPWIRDMFEPFYPGMVLSWPTGIDTTVWSPELKQERDTDFLIYDKIRWEHDQYQHDLIDPLCDILNKRSHSYQFIKYGSYSHDELIEKLSHAKSVIFLCEHETQGFAYQQIMATGTPVLAWDRGGYWQDLYYYPKIKYKPVSSVPYWDERCGMKFKGIEDFETILDAFFSKTDSFKPREYVLNNLTLEKCAEHYYHIWQQVSSEIE